MRIACLGGGPAGLYFALLMKQADPAHRITVIDRNAADNLRVYLLRADRIADVDALMPKLIAAYPDDYVYPYRYGRSLLDRGNAAAALPFLEQASTKAFGVNRLTVAGLRAKALIALNRRADAEKVVAEALEANGPWFPEAAAKLKATLKS